MVGVAIHEAYAPTMPGRTLGYMVNLIAEDSGHNFYGSSREYGVSSEAIGNQYPSKQYSAQGLGRVKTFWLGRSDVGWIGSHGFRR